ncbi:MAG TPA: lipopolysaccharide kinase InaA family protein [Verrucomicrobiae bacterium]|nr:lipopolysaccharide kinase InaA family protein [Verrucomicrobiae bacterium]
MRRTEYQGLRWELAPQFESLLPEVLQQPGESVKTSSVTTVTRHRVADREFYVKRYFHERRGLAPLSYFIRASKSRREWNQAPQFQSRGIAVVPHLAHGERWGWCGLLESVLITEGLAGYASLLTMSDAVNPEFQSALGRFLRSMHDAGILYLDISAKNVLYSATEHKFCLIDIDKVRLCPTIDESQRLGHLATFRSRFALTPAFYDGYGSEFSSQAAEIDQRAAAIRQARVARFSRVCLRHTHEVTKKRIGGLQWHIRRAYLDERLERILRDPDRHADNSEGLVVNRFAYRSGTKAYRQAYGLELTGKSTPRPVAAANKRVLGFVVRGYFVTKSP